MKKLLTLLLYFALIIGLYEIAYYQGYYRGQGKGFGRGKLEGFVYGVWYSRGDSVIINLTGEKNWLLENLHKEDSAMEVYNKSKIQQ